MHVFAFLEMEVCFFFWFEFDFAFEVVFEKRNMII